MATATTAAQRVTRVVRPVNPIFLHKAPFFQNGANLDLRCVLISDPGTLGAGAKTRLESRIKKLMPHRVCRPALLAGNLFAVPGALQNTWQINWL